jgi:hydrogenase expression/formation protein HypE
MTEKRITLSHGNGGMLTHQMISSFMVPAFDNPQLRELADSARISVAGQKLAFTTDSHVISPIFYPGGDIGKLSVTGTVNDLAVMGSKPMYLSCGAIIEEGFSFEDLRIIIQSIADTANEADVRIVTGDTKVVEKGAVDGIFINTSGIGILHEKAPKGLSSVQVGDTIILSGTTGDHGIAIYAKREDLSLETPLESDCAIVTPLVELAIQACDAIRIMRDPTRGGLATTLNEFVINQSFGIEVFEENIPVREPVRVLCELLGLDPLYMANEGKILMVVPESFAEDVVRALKTHPLGREAAIIGRITERFPGKVSMKTVVGGERIIDMLMDDPLPRIC